MLLASGRAVGTSSHSPVACTTKPVASPVNNPSVPAVAVFATPPDSQLTSTVPGSAAASRVPVRRRVPRSVVPARSSKWMPEPQANITLLPTSGRALKVTCTLPVLKSTRPAPSPVRSPVASASVSLYHLPRALKSTLRVPGAGIGVQLKT